MKHINNSTILTRLTFVSTIKNNTDQVWNADVFENVSSKLLKSFVNKFCSLVFSKVLEY